MTVGLSTTNLANYWLDELSTLATHGKLHTGDPGAAGATAASLETTRKAITWSPAAAGSKSMSGTLSWTSWTAGPETLSHLSAWNNLTTGNFAFSVAFSASRGV